jgi:hypothetical protein
MAVRVSSFSLAGPIVQIILVFLSMIFLQVVVHRIRSIADTIIIVVLTVTGNCEKCYRVNQKRQRKNKSRYLSEVILYSAAVCRHNKKKKNRFPGTERREEDAEKHGKDSERIKEIIHRCKDEFALFAVMVYSK